MILVIDNYDSFVHNLARYFRRLGLDTLVVRHDDLEASAVPRLRPRAIVLSPGPCAPPQAGCCLDVVRRFHRDIPMLGVCLGHQVIAAALGGRIVRASQPVHGRASLVSHGQCGVFAGLPNPFLAGRYHSLIVEATSLPNCLETIATLEDGSIMAIQHRRLPILGLQFHPESILTQHGGRLIEAFLDLAGIPANRQAAPAGDAVSAARFAARDWFRQPPGDVSFAEYRRRND